MREQMRHARSKAIGVAVMVLCPLIASTHAASADPVEPVPVDSATTDGGQPASGPLPGPVDSLVLDDPAVPDGSVLPNDSVAAVCKQFAIALNVASSNYEDFAYASAGGGNFVDYQDPNVARTALIARTALRESAAAALSSAQAPGLPQEVSDPMRSWSLRATKLSFILSLRGGGDSMNATVSDMNTDGHDAQMACAFASMHG
jgi:hypothetical protein